MGFLTFSCSKSYYYLLVYWILDLSIVIVRDIYLMEEIAEIDLYKGSEFVYISCLNIGDLFAGFLVLRTHFKMNSLKKSKNKEMEVEDEENKKEKKKKKKKGEK